MSLQFKYVLICYMKNEERTFRSCDVLLKQCVDAEAKIEVKQEPVCSGTTAEVKCEPCSDNHKETACCKFGDRPEAESQWMFAAVDEAHLSIATSETNDIVNSEVNKMNMSLRHLLVSNVDHTNAAFVAGISKANARGNSICGRMKARRNSNVKPV